jgi:hypothetical protein
MRNLIVLVAALAMAQAGAAAPWPQHTIDDSSRGADGVRLADINGDGRLDIATGWEEGGLVRVYLHPGAANAKERWPAVTVGKVKSPEDAVFVDFDGDGATDVLSSCEGNTRTAHVHFAPRERDKLLDPAAWRTEPIPATGGKQQWMYALPMDIDGRHGIDIVVGSKGTGASIGWLEAPEDRRDVSAWKYRRLRDARWIMSLVAEDIDADGDSDLLASDRNGPTRGIFLLENRGDRRWRAHAIGGGDHEVMFLDCADLDADGRKEIVVAAKQRRVLVFSKPGEVGALWAQTVIELSGNLGNAKAVRVADLDRDGSADLVVSCEGATGDKSGVAYFTRDKKASAGESSARWTMHDISGPPGTKFDRIELVDVDDDGDLDVLTCEEAENLGVIWYENPTR